MPGEVGGGDISDAVLDPFLVDLSGKRLWHYTSEACARKIVRTGILRLTSSRFMNDPSEGKLGPALVRAGATEYAVEHFPSHNTPAGSALRYSPGALRVRNDFEAFLTSFGIQENYAQDGGEGRRRDGSDSLSQWAMYGDDGNGVALVFEISGRPKTPIFEVDQKLIHQGKNLPYSCDAEFCQVKYVPLEKQEVLKALKDRFRAAKVKPGDGLRLACDVFGEYWRPMLKSDFYAQEHECRLVAKVRSDLATNGYLTESRPVRFTKDGRPYLRYHWSDSLKLVGYWLGPKRTEHDAAAARLYLGQLGFGDVNVKNSRGAYRGRG